MRKNNPRWPVLVGLTTLAALTVTVGAATAQAKRTRTGDYNNYIKQLTARFNAWDTNRDKVLDKYELAKAFRGPSARPFDGGNDTTPAALKGTFDRDYLKVLARMTPYTAKVVPAINLALADLLYRDLSVVKSGNLADYSNLADVQFILIAGTTGLPKLTKSEYDGFAKTYASSLADAEEASRKLKEAQGRLQKAKTAAAKMKAAADVMQRQQNLAVANTAIQAIPAVIQQKLAVRR